MRTSGGGGSVAGIKWHICGCGWRAEVKQKMRLKDVNMCWLIKCRRINIRRNELWLSGELTIRTIFPLILSCVASHCLAINSHDANIAYVLRKIWYEHQFGKYITHTQHTHHTRIAYVSVSAQLECSTLLHRIFAASNISQSIAMTIQR